MKSKRILLFVFSTLALNCLSQEFNEVERLQPFDYPSVLLFFGFSVSISGNNAIVGAMGDNPDGAVYFYEKANDSGWREVQRVTDPDNSMETGFFGTSVSISGNYAIVGDDYNDEEITGISYVLEKINGMWEIVEILENPFPEEIFSCGHSVSIDGNYAIVGCSGGKVFIYERQSNGQWIRVENVYYPSQSDPFFSLDYGREVAIKGDVAIVGDPGAPARGAVYFLTRDENGDWMNYRRISNPSFPSDPGSYGFGWNVDISENYAIVSASTDSNGNCSAIFLIEKESSGDWSFVQKISGCDINDGEINQFGYDGLGITENYAMIGAAADHPSDLSGSVYIYERSNTGSWELFQVINSSNALASDLFGRSIAADGNNIIVGAHGELTNPPGAAYIFSIDGTSTANENLSHLEQIFFSPNPAGNFLNIHYSDLDDQTASVLIFSLDGKLISNKKLSIWRDKRIAQINIMEIRNKSMYFVQLRTKEGSITKKVIVE